MSFPEIQERNSYVCQYCRGINTMALGSLSREKTEQYSFKLTPYTFAVASTIKGQYRTWENTFRQLIDAWMHSPRSQSSLVKVPVQVIKEELAAATPDLIGGGVWSGTISDIQEEELKFKRKKRKTTAATIK